MPTATESNLIWGTGPSSEVHWNSRLYEPFKNNFQAYLVLLFHIFFLQHLSYQISPNTELQRPKTLDEEILNHSAREWTGNI